MENKLTLSYSTINNCLQKENSHNWLNKLLKIKQEETIYMTAGRAGHDIIQAHVFGMKPDPRIKYLTEHFPIVEEKDFDERCAFTFEIDGYKMRGFYDGLDMEHGRFLEIKLTNTKPWTLMRFQDAVQRKIYKLSNPKLTESVLITGNTNPDLWENEKLKVFSIALTDRDAREAEKWIRAGIKILEDGDYNGGLDEDGRCNLFRCPWGNNCHFKHI